VQRDAAEAAAAMTAIVKALQKKMDTKMRGIRETIARFEKARAQGVGGGTASWASRQGNSDAADCTRPAAALLAGRRAATRRLKRPRFCARPPAETFCAARSRGRGAACGSACSNWQQLLSNNQQRGAADCY
jgi:hypothetical protein